MVTGQVDGIDEPQACDAMRKMLGSSELIWLLHRAAQRLGEVMEFAAAKHDVTMRAQLVLGGLAAEPGRTQLALGAALGLDKTTLTIVLDKLESKGLVIRRPSPTDRRVRIPELTEAGREVQEQVAACLREVEREALSTLAEADQPMLKRALWTLVSSDLPSLAGVPHPAGSCM